MTRWMIAFRLSLVAAAVSIAAGYGIGAYHADRARAFGPMAGAVDGAQQNVALRDFLNALSMVHLDRAIGWIVALAIIALYFAVRWAVAGRLR